MKKTAFFLLIVTLFFSGVIIAEEQGTNTGPSVDLLYGKGVELFFADRYAEAADLFQQASEKDEENPAYLYFLGLCRFRDGDQDEARFWFIKGAEAEFTPRGALIYVPGHLRKIQGSERVFIEQIRKDTALAWQEKEKKRQIALYGDFVDRHRRQLCNGLTAKYASGNVDSVSASTTENPLSIPMVPPIRPLARPEEDGYVSEILAQSGVDDIIELRDEYVTDQFGNVLKDENGKPILKTSLSTAEQKRIALKKRRDEERKKAQESFVDIFSDGEVSSDETAFGGESANAEKNPSDAATQPKGSAKDQVLTSIFGNLNATDEETASDEENDPATEETPSDENAVSDAEEE